jgi:A/G-specific adenine glycosylase
MKSGERPLADRARVRGERVRLFQSRLLAWFGRSARSFPWRRRRATHYQKVLAEVLLQRTRADVVSHFLPPFLKCFPSWTTLARATEKEVATFLRPLGLWRRRSKALKRLARELAFRKGRFPKDRRDIESLPGVGQYIGNAVLLFCHRQPEPLLDVNMARVLERYFGPRTLADIRYDPYLQSLAHQVVRRADAASVNWAILDLAALVCTKLKPRCAHCPLIRGCLYGREALHGIVEHRAVPPGSRLVQTSVVT